MIDLHSHILPDLDDGAHTLDDSLEMARAYVAEGVTAVAATPHVRAADYPTTPIEMEASLTALQVEVEHGGIPLRLLPGGEIALDILDAITPSDLRRFGLGGNPAYMLLEFPYRGWPLGLPGQISRLAASGVTPVIAHPERSSEVQFEPDRVETLVRAGALIQVTAASLDGRLGRSPRKSAFELLRLGLVHLIGSDAHDAGGRGTGLAAACRAIGDGALAYWLTVGVPSAIVNGTPLPARPPVRPWRRLWPR